MVLCFGAFANILMLCALPGTTNKMMVSTLVSTIDPENKYGDKYSDTAVSKLMNCQRNFPNGEISPGNGAIIDNGGALTSIASLSKSVTTQELSGKFDSVVSLLDEDKKRAAVGILRHLIQEDDSLEGDHRALFIKCMGNTAAHVVNVESVDLCSFLAGIFLYTVLTNENTTGKPYINNIRSKAMLQRFSAYRVAFQKMAPTSETSIEGVPDGVSSYMGRLSEKCNRIPSILFKDALTPFHDYYVPNDVIWYEPVPEKRNSHYIRRINGADVASLLNRNKIPLLQGIRPSGVRCLH